MGDQKINLEGLRAQLHEHEPEPYKNGQGWTIIDMWHVVDQLLTVVEEQEKQIKALEEYNKALDDEKSNDAYHQGEIADYETEKKYSDE